MFQFYFGYFWNVLISTDILTILLLPVAMTDSDTAKGLLYACLALVGLLITITIFLIYALLFRVKRQFVYHVSITDSQARQHGDTADLVITETSATGEQPRTIENQGDTEDDKDTDSLTRNLSFSKFERPQQPDKTVHPEDITTREEPLAHSENIESAPQIAENAVDDDNESDVVSKRLSFSTFDKLIERASTTKVIESREFSGTTEYSTIQEEEPGTSENIQNTEDPMRIEQEGSLRVAGNLETVSENYLGIPEIDDSTEGTYSVTRGVLVSIHQRPDDTTHGEGITEDDEPLGQSEKIENIQITENEHAVDDDNESDIMSRALTFSTFDSLIEHVSTTKIVEASEFSETTGNVTTHQRPDIPPTADNANNNSINDVTAPSIPSSKQREEKQVSFSGNDSTYIVERRGKSVQLMQCDETSNFEFVKFFRQHQQQKRT